MSTPHDPTLDPAVSEVAICASTTAPARTPSQCAFPETSRPDTAALQDALRRPTPPDHAYRAKKIRRALARSKARPPAEALALQAHILNELFLDYLLENASDAGDVDLALRAQKQFMNAFQALEKKQTRVPEPSKT